MIENSKVGDSSSNSRTERAIQEVGGMIRTLKFALEDRTGGGKINLSHPEIPWIAKHAAAQITRYQIRASGKTSYNSIKGYDCRDHLAEFGECILFRPPKTQHEKRHKKVLAERAVDGLWLGTDIKTSANIVATADGVFFAGRILRKAPGDRWSRKAIDDIRGCPQEPAPGRGRAIPNFVRSELCDGGRAQPPPDTLPAVQEETRVLPMFVRKADVRAFGRSPGCRGCRDMILEKPTCSPHTRECRSRMEK